MSRSAGVLRPDDDLRTWHRVKRLGLSSHKKVDNQAYRVILASRQDSAASRNPVRLIAPRWEGSV